MQVAVCDDNELHLIDMKEKLSSLQMVSEASYFSDLSAFLSSIDKGCTYDAVLMDIDWNQSVTGMDAAAELYKRRPDIAVIYVTGHSDMYSQRIFLSKANLSGFISKPVDMEILRENLQKAAEAVSSSEQPAIVVRQHGAITSIPYSEIFYIESWKHTIIIHCASESIVSYERLSGINVTLPTGFYQCHKSFIVNMRQIQRFQRDGILLKNGKSIPVSRSKYVETKAAYLGFIGKTF